MKSIMQTQKECYICHCAFGLQKHHIYEGSRRQISERNGFTVYLCPDHHTMSAFSAHRDPGLNKWLKQQCQRMYERTHSRAEFIALIGKNYLGDEGEAEK